MDMGGVYINLLWKKLQSFCVIDSSFRETDIENRPMAMAGGEEEGELYGESNIEVYKTICKIDSQWEFALWLRELKSGLCNNLEGWDGEGDGMEVQGRRRDIPMADSCWCLAETQFCKATILQWKKKLNI